MRVNIYAEEMTDVMEIFTKEVDGRNFTGLRFYLHLPVTLKDGTQAQGPFMHHPGDDDSSAVTFWGKRDLRILLHKALHELDVHYGDVARNQPSDESDSPMSFDQYQVLAMKTAKDMGSVQMNLIHSAMGLGSDAGEYVDVIKAHTIYGKELDLPHAVEELGDSLWFIILAAQTLGVSLDHIMKSNIEKLQKRYPNKYTNEAAVARADKQTENK